MKKIVAIVGGGTISHVRSHLALCAPAYGETARTISMYCNDKLTKTMQKHIYLTKMADSNSSLVTNEDMKQLAISLNEDLLTTNDLLGFGYIEDEVAYKEYCLLHFIGSFRIDW